MNSFRGVGLAAVVAVCFVAMIPRTEAQVRINIGVPPACPYGYYDYPPYDCAPYGYYGPEWFSGGVFIGAGPWFHGHRDFHGRVDNRFDPRHGYRGERPNRGERADAGRRPDRASSFKGNETRDGHGHEVPRRH